MDDGSVVAYGLTGFHCEECGRAKSLRLLGYLTGCKTCDDVITRHRCAGRPALDDLAVSESWQCPECGSLWTVTEEADTCGECGRTAMIKAWDCVPGDRLDSAPRYQPPQSLFVEPFPPFAAPLVRSLLSVRGPGGDPRARVPLGSCYRTENGLMVHVKPGCRC